MIECFQVLYQAPARFRLIKQKNHTGLLMSIPAIKMESRRFRSGRLPANEMVRMAALRNMFHREYGVYFDAEEFSENDLYARSVLSQCLFPHAPPLLKSIARKFLDAQNRPRLHRRTGWVHLDLNAT